MPRNKPRQANTPEATAKRMIFNLTVDSSAEGILHWDLKEELVVSAIRYILSTGCAVMFGVRYDGTAISVTVMDGDQRTRKWCNDAIEFEDALGVIVAQGKAAAAAQSSHSPGA